MLTHTHKGQNSTLYYKLNKKRSTKIKEKKKKSWQLLLKH